MERWTAFESRPARLINPLWPHRKRHTGQSKPKFSKEKFMDIIAKRLSKVAPSLTLKVTNQAKAMKARGEEVYGLAGGEPEMDTPDFIKAAAVEALAAGKTKYTPAAGIPELREALARKFVDVNKIQCEATEVIVSPGAKFSCTAAMLAVLDEGDEVLIPSPYWVSYPDMVTLAGAVPVFVETKAENGWKMTAEEFEEHMSPKTKMVIINSPSNPTGAVYTREELKALAEVALEEEIVILSDEIYEKLVYGEAEHVSMASLSREIAELTITINGFSKAYSMTGWRLGYATASGAIAKAMSNIQSHLTSNPTTFAQYGALAAIEGAQNFVNDLREEYDIRRQYVSGRLSEIPNVSFVEPQGAFYFLVETSQLQLTSLNLAEKLLSRYRVACVPGIAFGNDYSIRLSYCTTLDVLKEGLDRFEAFCRDH